MSDSLLNISGKIDSVTVALYESVSAAAEELDIPFVVVGASARDIVLHYGYGALIQRATTDADFGIEVSGWSAFEALKEILLEKGFTDTRAQHRLISSGNVPVDIVPFGQIEDENSNIQWTNSEMNVLGFQDVCDSAEIVRIQDEPPVDIPVATPAGMAVLKLIAWTDREADMRGKDAKDLLYLFTTYEKIPAVSDDLFEDQSLMERYDWELSLASAHQLGIDAELIVENQTYDVIANFFEDRHEHLSVERLIEEMCERIEHEYESNEELTMAFINGFLRKQDEDDE